MRPRTNEWLSVAQAAAALGVASSTVHRWRVNGQLADVRTVKRGAYTYYARADIERLKSALEAGPDADPGETAPPDAQEGSGDAN